MYTKKYAKSMFGSGYGKLIDRLFKEVGAKHISGIKPKYGRIDLYIDGSEELQYRLNNHLMLLPWCDKDKEYRE